MKLIKKVTAVIMVLAILVTGLRKEKVVYAADSSSVGAMVAQGVTAAGTAVSGLTLGGLIALVFSMVAVGCTVDMTDKAITEWNNPLSSFKNDVLTTTNTAVKDWFIRAGEQTTNIQDTGASFVNWVATGNIADLDIWDWIIPTENNYTLEIPTDVAEYVKNYLCTKYQLSSLQPGTYNSDRAVIDGLYQNIGYNVTTSNNFNELYSYKNIVVYYVINYGYKQYQILASNDNFNTVRTAIDGVITYIYDSYGNPITRFGNCDSLDKYVRCKTLPTLMYGVNDVKEPVYNVVYNTFDIVCGDNVIKNRRTEMTIPKSDYILDGAVAGVMEPNSLRVNKYLTDNVKEMNLTDGITSDVVVGALRDADIDAEKNYADVISGDITTADPTEADQWGIGAALKAFAKWLFVPSQAAVAEYIATNKSKLENQTGVLTYPLTLVIEFLNKCLNLEESDCILIIPEISFKGNKLLERTEFNLTEFVHKSEFTNIYSIYIKITNFIMIIGVVTLAWKKGQEIIRGN